MEKFRKHPRNQLSKLLKILICYKRSVLSFSCNGKNDDDYAGDDGDGGDGGDGGCGDGDNGGGGGGGDGGIYILANTY